MRVKKLEIFGFKSFAQRTTVHFEPGVTAIVGPNGSGKSNIVDGIRWVLGEHNPRDVRAPRLEDVIFNGTDRKAPLSVAEVSLTIDNEKGLLPISFTEVAITRRVFRSGESEYFINQSPCRLKDIQELFLGTGLGGGTYAIIEQGHIDMVLSSKPEERRVVFEEASGVAKYLAKKQETMRRLDEVEGHLVRLADIIAEIRRQVSALERAANKARQYQTQWEQLKSLELRLAVDELCAGETRYHALEVAVGGLEAKRAGLEAERTRHMTSLEACNAEVSATQQALQTLRTKVVEGTSQIDQHEAQAALKARWIDELAAQIRQLELEEAQLTGRVAQVAEQLTRAGASEVELLAQTETVQAQHLQSGNELETLEGTLHTVLESVNAGKAQLFEAAATASHARNQVAEHASRLQSLDAQCTRLEEQRTQRRAHGEDVGQRAEAAGRERDTLRTQHDELQQRFVSVQQALDAAGARRHELAGRVHHAREQLASERARAKVLEDLWRRYEGFPDAVKTLMGQSIDGLVGPLVDLVQAAPGYEEVVEAALGPLAEALVVRDRRALARCKIALRDQQMVGCRFLVLSDVPATPLVMVPPVLQEGFAGSVKQYVQADAAYQPLVDWLLNDSWLIDDIERLLNEGPVPQNRLVSPRGDRWDRRSWRFGGAQPAAQGRVGRRQRWEQAQAVLANFEQEFTQSDAQAREAEQQWQTLLAQQESTKGQLSHLAPSLHKAEAHATQLLQERERIEEEWRAMEFEVAEVGTQREEVRAALAASQQAAEEAQARQQAIEQSLAASQAQRESATHRRQELLIAKAQVETTLHALTERRAALLARSQELQAERAQLAEQAAAKIRQREEARQRSTDLAQQMASHRQGGEQLAAERVRLSAEAESVAQRLQAEETKRDQALPLLLAVEQQLSALMREIETQRQQLSERTFRRTRLVERLRELYQIDETTIHTEQQAAPAALTEAQRASMGVEVQKLRAKLEGIGPVSLGSVEEYDELKRRLDFLQTQQQDLLRAREDLKTSISQINRTARTQFRETFARIRQEFQHYYTRLFNGGEADLLLLDEEEVLESGIDIVARPPGKRLQSISLLSGGERALTAIALLFALFKVRPSPFCILDEIDAPLDEANVDRFTRVLEEFLILSQFILITHNKKTITKADCLYGVTMEEPGISKILSAKLGKPAEIPTPAASVAA